MFTLFLEIFSGRKKKSMYLLPYRVRFSLNIQSITVLITWGGQSCSGSQYLRRGHLLTTSPDSPAVSILPQTHPDVQGALIFLPCHWGVNWRVLSACIKLQVCIPSASQSHFWGIYSTELVPSVLKWLVHQVTHCGIVCHSTWREASYCGVNLQSLWRGLGSLFCDSRSKDMTQTETVLSTKQILHQLLNSVYARSVIYKTR